MKRLASIKLNDTRDRKLTLFFNSFLLKLLTDLQTPSSEGSAAALVSGGTIPRRSSTIATRKPVTTDDMHVNLVMKMGFNRKIVELAVRTLRK